ncbi:RluA family pseudouridine synthase [Bacillus sp. 31A1R]|uniref:Pseudouridine synthase n=1 Tax=Robertmurraya mangrovi TaxID=3098077 RepID=A0ABU5J3G9_9BACI|nr:RluA family pseudouridine synthase [Bacillus sp. 31A1R]MDZ5473952.1 RluA family pseudouridine synthase [Bacillus sp. 31A1R]
MIKTSKKGEWFELVIPEEWSSYTLDQLLRDHWKVSKKQIHLFRMEKNILINGQPPQWNRPLQTGDPLSIKLFTPEDYGVIPQNIDIDILFEDDHLLIVNKPAGIDTHPNQPEQSNTLANAVAFYLQVKGENRQVKHIHRLDRDTTGAILFAKHSLIGSILDKMLEERKIKRTYLALVQGLLNKKSGTINEPIGADRHHPTRRRVSPRGQHAVTHFTVIDRYNKEKRTLVKCQLNTGRTHQIRVHLSHIGHPLLGDDLYGGTRIYKRQALHAVKMEFKHPLTMEEIECHAPFLDQPPIFKNIDPYSI